MVPIVAVIIAVVAVLCMGIGYFIGSVYSTRQKPESEDSSLTTVANSASESEADDVLAVETEYGTLYFPEQWYGCFRTEQTEQDDYLTVTFIAVFEDAEYPMFAVIIGSYDGSQIGELCDANGTVRQAYLEVFEYESLDGLSNDQQRRLYAMQEDLNYVISYLK